MVKNDEGRTKVGGMTDERAQAISITLSLCEIDDPTPGMWEEQLLRMSQLTKERGERFSVNQVSVGDLRAYAAFLSAERGSPVTA